MDLSGAEIVEIIHAIPTLFWVFFGAVAGPLSLYLFVSWSRRHFGSPAKEQAVANLSWDAVLAENERLRDEVRVLRAALARSRGFAAKVINHFAKCKCLEQLFGREHLAEIAQEVISETA